MPEHFYLMITAGFCLIILKNMSLHTTKIQILNELLNKLFVMGVQWIDPIDYCTCTSCKDWLLWNTIKFVLESDFNLLQKIIF